MRTILAATLVIGLAAAAAHAAEPAADEFRRDFGLAIEGIASSYAYFDGKATRWADVSGLYAADLRGVTDRDQFVALLERVVEELYDPHAHLTVNLRRSPRLVPSGADLWAEWRDGEATVTQVRADSDAERAGIGAGAGAGEDPFVAAALRGLAKP